MTDKIICGQCEHELELQAPVYRSPQRRNSADSTAIMQLLMVLRQLTFTTHQAEHLIVMIKGRTDDGAGHN